MSDILARGQVAWLAAAGRPTRRADAPASEEPVNAVRLTADEASDFIGDLRIESAREVLVMQRNALGSLEHGMVIVHDDVRCQILSGPNTVPPDRGLVVYGLLGGE
ncbi:MAG: hypothetical protein H7099_15790 [Gemmatimonadaceae bacterium]|nr:hypothetical protein [Gemmatimonadaceae bacterium]